MVMSKRLGRLRTLDGVIMLSSDGRPAAGAFPENVWVVMGCEEDCIEDFFGPSADVLTAGLEESIFGDDTRYCVGFDSKRQQMVMNGGGAYPVYVSGLLRVHQKGLHE
jgi:hypothetical protein